MVTIAELRARNGKMSQKELAEKLKTSQTTISMWEKNPLSMGSKGIIAVCKFFKVSADDLLGINDRNSA